MNIYQSLYTLLETYVFGGNIVVGSNPDLVATLCSVFGTVALISLPFLIVWKIIKVLLGG